jgi:twitching motility protein PilT
MASSPSPTAAPPAPSPVPGTGQIFNFKAVLQQLVQRNASDLHLKVGRPPTLRLHGDLLPLDHPALRPEDLKGLAEQLMTPRQVKEFTENKECDFAIGVPGIGRFRCNVSQ